MVAVRLHDPRYYTLAVTSSFSKIAEAGIASIGVICQCNRSQLKRSASHTVGHLYVAHKIERY